MLTYAAVVSRSGPLSDAMIERLKTIGPRAVAFRDMSFESKVWRSDSGRLAIAAWCNDATHPQHAGLIHEDGPAALTLSGYAYEGSIQSQADLLGRLRSSTDPRDAIIRLGGVYTIALADGATDTLRAWNSFLPTEPLYVAETPELTVVGTRALLVHLIASGKDVPEYDMQRFGAFMSAGYFCDVFTPFKGVDVLPPNHEVTASPSGCRRTSIDDLEWRIGESAVEPTDAFWDEMTQTMLNTMEAVKSFGGEIKLHLSGGKDSRVLAGALTKAGATFKARTGGFREHPDVVGATEVAEILGLDHTVDTPIERDERGEIETDILQHTAHWMFKTDGMINAWGGWVTPSTSFVPLRQIIGQGGEYLRGGWLKHPDNRADVDYDKCWRLFESKLYPNGEYIRESAMKPYLDFLHRLVPAGTGADIEGLMERAFAFTYGWHWAPPGLMGVTSQQHRYYPFCDSRLLRLGYQLPWRERLKEEPHFNMMVRLHPELPYRSFTKFRWGFEAEGPVEGRRPESWADRAPRTPPPVAQVRTNWQKNVGVGALRDEFRQQIFENPAADQIFEALDREKLLAMFDSQTMLVSHANRFMWNVYAASVIVSNAWLEPTYPSRPIRVQADYQWSTVHRRLLRGMESGRRAAETYAQKQLEKWGLTIAKRIEKGRLDIAAVASDNEASKGLSDINYRATEIYIERILARLGRVQDELGIDDASWSGHLNEIKVSTAGGGDLSLATVLAGGDTARVLTSNWRPDPDRVTREVSALGQGVDGGVTLGVLDPVDDVERGVLASIGLATVERA